MSENTTESGTRRILLVGDTTLDPLGRLLERGQGTPRLRTSAAPYGQVYQILLDPNHASWAFQPDLLVVWTAPQFTLPSVGKLLRFELDSATIAFEAALREAQQFAEAVLRVANRVGLVLVPTWVLPNHERWIQTLTWRQGAGLANLLAKANLILAEKFATRQNIVFLDTGYWQASMPWPRFSTLRLSLRRPQKR
jgi:hypothetical protein